VSGLHLAAAAGHLSMVKYLLEEHKLDPDLSTGESKSKPIHLAATGGHKEVLQHLMEECKSDPTETDKNLEDCLTLAIKNKHPKLASFLIKTDRFDLTKVLAVKGFSYFSYALVKG
jgi:ankyrin repeat protein